MLTKYISLLHVCNKIFENKHGVLQTIIYHFIPQKRIILIETSWLVFIVLL